MSRLGTVSNTQTSFFISHNTPRNGTHFIVVTTYNSAAETIYNPSLAFHDVGEGACLPFFL
jgi:hypothetical protein